MRRSSVADTPAFISFKNAFEPHPSACSRKTRANMRSTGVARFFNLPDLVQAARWRPRGSSGAQHPPHVASVIGRERRILSKSNTRNRCGGTTNSGAVGACAKTTPALRPEWDRRCARFEADWPDSMVLFLKVRSEAEDAQYCQPCCHSPGSFDGFVGGRLPLRNSDQLGRSANPS